MLKYSVLTAMLMSGVLLSGCQTIDSLVTQTGESANPVVDVWAGGEAEYAADLVACRKLVATNQPWVNSVEQGLTAGVVGGVAGAASGAALTMSSGGALVPAAAAGAIAGSVGGTIVGTAATILNEANAPSTIVGRCLMHRSIHMNHKYRVIKYQ